MTQDTNTNVLSLFSSAGIGELGLKSCGLNILLSNELLQNRCALYMDNYPDTVSICGDIWDKQSEIISKWQEFGVGSPYILYATPPCQGMSFNSVGKRLQEIRAGRRPKDDERNRLIIPTINIAKELRPIWLLLENVQGMENTIIPLPNGTYTNIIEYIHNELSFDYIGKAEVVNCADYGIPQTRVRLISIFTRSNRGKQYFEKHHTFLPSKSHSSNPSGTLLPWVSLKNAIGHLNPLSSELGKNVDGSNPLHIVPVMKPEKFWWVSCTPYNETAYNNQCVKCGYTGNPRHGMCFVRGRHTSKSDTPIYCSKCGALLPRPSMIDKISGERRRIKGFDSAYKRMNWESPAPTLTQLFQSEASDKKIHPTQNRTLSIYEAMIIQTIADYTYHFTIKNSPISLNSICQVIGESVPPRLIELIARQILRIDNGEI